MTDKKELTYYGDIYRSIQKSSDKTHSISPTVRINQKWDFHLVKWSVARKLQSEVILFSVCIMIDSSA